jgi:hypothetical protein
MAETDPECRVFGARRHQWRLAPPVPEAVVARHEREHRFELPASYRSFITTVSSGGAGPAYGLYEFGSKSWVDWQEDLDLLPVPFPHNGPFRPSPERSVCAEHAPGEEDFSPCWFTSSLVIAEIKRLITRLTDRRPTPAGHLLHWLTWRRRRQVSGAAELLETTRTQHLKLPSTQSKHRCSTRSRFSDHCWWPGNSATAVGSWRALLPGPHAISVDRGPGSRS